MKSKLFISIFLAFWLHAASAYAVTYYLSPSGNDLNAGTSSSVPWLSVNHPVSCRDVILAAPSSAYSASEFTLDWGTVNCPSGNSVAWLQCAVFDGCKITAPGTGIWVNQSYWGIEGWEVTTTGGLFSPCFYASPSTSSSPVIHHIVFANDIANGCYGSGFALSNQGLTGVDYFAVVGSAIYNAVQGGAACFSGMNIAAPVASDTQPGTHIYIGGIFTWNNFEPTHCNGGAPTDGEGIVLDTLDADSYTQQVVVDDNISFLNGSSGIRTGMSTKAAIYIRNNTSYGNNGDSHIGAGECGEIVSQASENVEVYNNLARTSTGTGCGGSPNYTYFVQTPFAADVFNNNFGYSAAGNNTGQSGGFTFGSGNQFGTDPGFVNPPVKDPGAPNCNSFSSVPACMSNIVAALTPTNTAAIGYGYHSPSSIQIYDALFPQWLCNVNLPGGLVTMGCLSAPTPTPSLPTGSSSVPGNTTGSASASNTVGFLQPSSPSFSGFAGQFPSTAPSQPDSAMLFGPTSGGVSQITFVQVPLLNPGSTESNTIAPTGTAVPLTLRGDAHGSNIQDWYTGSGGHIAYMDQFGDVAFLGYGVAINGSLTLGSHLNQNATRNFAGTCTMSSSSSCTWTQTNPPSYSVSPICIATEQGRAAIAGACSLDISTGVVTITAASPNSYTWGSIIVGNPN